MKPMRKAISYEPIRNRKGKLIGSHEIINEFYERGHLIETLTRGILRLADGRVLVNRIIQKQQSRKKGFNRLNLLTGEVE